MISTAPAGSFPTGTDRVVHTAVWLALVSLFLSSRLAVADEAIALKRWAILASPELQQSGAAELTLVAISQAEGIELVERDQLQLAAKELKIEALGGAGGAGGRIQLGRLLKADALMLLSVQQYEGGQYLKAVVCDCASGARLRLEYVPYASERPEQAAEKCRGVMEAVRGHFADGVKQVIGVSSFVSKNLVHDYDHLQAGYARLLESALAAYPGVAVMETEEAQAIGRELLVSGPGEIRRFVPLLVEVDFLVQPAAGEEEPQIFFTIRTRSAGEVGEPAVDTEQMPLSRAPEFVTQQLPLRCIRVGHSNKRTALSRQQQICWLIERADAFSQLGAWSHATGLREAALLLAPHLAQQRLKLILEYRKIFFDLFLDNRVTREYLRQKDREVIDDPDRLRPFYVRAAAYLAALPHLEYLVRHRQIDPWLAVEFGKNLSTRRLAIGLPMEGLTEKLRRQVLRRLAVAERAEMAILTDVFPLILNRSEGPVDDEQGHGPGYHILSMGVAEAMFDGAIYRRDRDYLTGEDLADIRRVIELADKHNLAVAPIGFQYLDRARHRYEQGGAAEDSVGKEEWVAFREEFAKFCLRAQDNSPFVVQSTPYKLRQSAGSHWRHQPRILSPSPGSNGSQVVFGRLCFERIDLRVRQLDGQTKRLLEGLEDLVAYDGLDLAWSKSAVFLMRTPGLLEPVLEHPDEQIVGAAWDGQWAWVAAMDQGIIVVDGSGKQLARIGSREGLPPHDKKLILHPIAPGRCIVSGQFGGHGRAWCAMIQRKETEPGFDVDVFHEATKVPLKDRDNTPDDPQLVFEPIRFHECDTPLDGRRVLYLDRRAPSNAGHGKPLVIDPETLEVRIAKNGIFHGNYGITVRRLPGFPGSPTYRPYQFHIPHWEPMNGEWPEGKPELCRGETWDLWIVYWDGWLYHIHGPWFRVNAQTWQYEYLIDGLLPPGYRLEHHAVSAHYGLIGWSGSGYYRVTVSEVNGAEREK